MIVMVLLSVGLRWLGIMAERIRQDGDGERNA